MGKVKVTVTDTASKPPKISETAIAEKRSFFAVPHIENRKFEDKTNSYMLIYI